MERSFYGKHLFIKQIKLHPDNMAVTSYGMTDTMGRMHSDAQFAGSSSVPAHVEMMGFWVSVTTRW